MRGIGTLLFILFLTLKLTGLIAWSWWWVTSPLWLPAVFAIFFLGFVVMLAAFVTLIKS